MISIDNVREKKTIAYGKDGIGSREAGDMDGGGNHRGRNRGQAAPATLIAGIGTASAALLRFCGRKLLLLAICLVALLGATCHADSRPGMIYIPLDDRPVCYEFPVKVMEAAGYRIYTPPAKYLASREHPANVEAIWQWLEHRAEKVQAAVISTDTLIYGGLVPSRTHHFTQAQLDARVQRLKDLRLDSGIRFYAFSTLMRTPRESYGDMEPDYYSKVGPAIFRYSQLSDKSDMDLDTVLDKYVKNALERNMVKANLKDWLERRDKNLRVNHRLAMLGRTGRFDYFAIGKDDNAPLSHTHMEARQIALENGGTGDDTFQILPGVDQLGLLLLTRAANEMSGTMPKVYQLYPEGPGSETVPQYSDLPLGQSVPQQVLAAGGTIVQSPEAADIILAVNSPADGEMRDSTDLSNQYFASPANRRYIYRIGELLDSGKTVTLADIAYSNGGDNGLMNELSLRNYTGRLAAYNGWNTADNAVGFAIAQGMLADRISPANRTALLQERILDDWYYQSNARRMVTRQLEESNQVPFKYNLKDKEKSVKATVLEEMESLAKRYPVTRDILFDIAFPWHRLFEIDIVSLTLRK